MKKFWYLLLIPLFMGLAACGDDDEEDGVGSSDSLVGLWQMSHVKGSVVENGNTYTFDVNVSENNLEDFYEADVADFTRFEFTSDGIFRGWEYDEDDQEWHNYTDDDWNGANVKYTLSGNKLVLSNGNKRLDEEMTVKSLTSSTLVLHTEEEEYEGTDVYKLSMDVTFKKIR